MSKQFFSMRRTPLVVTPFCTGNRLILGHMEHSPDLLVSTASFYLPRLAVDRLVGHYARDMKLATIPAMIAHMTSRPAKRLSIYPHRGLIAEGSAADLVLFDPETIEDMATYEEPKLTSKGIRFVLVNGVIALDETVMTGSRAGRTLRRRSDGKVTTCGL